MQYSKLLAVTLAFACPDFAVSTQSAFNLQHSKMKPFHSMKGQVLDKNPNTPRLVAARKDLADEAKGLVTEKALADVSTGWTAKHKLYVGCVGTPDGSTFPTIQEAVAAAQLYTVIKVCPGTYYAGGADTGITVNMSYIEIEGASAAEAAEVLWCDSTPQPTDNSYGFLLLGSHDVVKNMSIAGCDFAIESGLNTEVIHNQIVNNWFDGNFARFTSTTAGRPRWRATAFWTPPSPSWTTLESRTASLETRLKAMAMWTELPLPTL